jgi:hypothetical protein
MLVSVVTGYLSPSSFTFLLSVQLLAMVVIGGRIHPFGPAVGAAVFALYQRYLPASTWDDAILGGTLALAVWLAPRGLAVYVSLGLEKLGHLVQATRARLRTGKSHQGPVDELNVASVSSVGRRGD